MNSRTLAFALGSLITFVTINPARADVSEPNWNGPSQCTVNPERTPQSDEPLPGFVACQVGDDVHPITPESMPGIRKVDALVWTLVLIKYFDPLEVDFAINLFTIPPLNLLPHP